MIYSFSDDVLALNPELRAIVGKPARRAAKYGNIPTVVDGIRFDSKKEAKDYCTLKLLEQAGQIVNLRLQPAFDLPGGIRYIADFIWDDTHTKRTHVKDTKGFKTPAFKLKEKLFRATYPQYVFEVG